MLLPDPDRVALAGQRFAAFFRELQQAFLERDEVLAQIALGLLAKEHVLLTGPPGTAKSQVSSAVLGRILDEGTGRPSLYARQFTESTVQTDLVGPINFKTLMETGRTEHFTDQGMLGAVHAFLDEVFDGRDMLLRSALNVLQERELKEGTRTVRGLIECAVMTSNRYLAEVLEGSRDTLLAFVDRIAFVSFLPRGFADPQNLAAVLRRHVGRGGDLRLDAPLSIQDLDALQAQVDAVGVSDAACDAIASFLEAIEVELREAAKADPSFVPTRYISTRTAVRCGRVLRAIVVFDRAFRDPQRPLEVRADDFRWLGLHLLLCGPSPQMVDKLLARETDPRERRQLAIVRTEREAFDRCLAKLPPIPVAPPAPTAQLHLVETVAAAAIGSDDPADISASLRQVVPVAQGGGPDAERAAQIARRLSDDLVARALRAALDAPVNLRGVAIADRVVDLEKLAATVDDPAPDGRPGNRLLAAWLRGRAVDLIDAAASFDVGADAGDVASLSDASSSGPALRTRAEARIAEVERLLAVRRRLVAAGAQPRSAGEGDTAWRAAVTALEEDAAALLDGWIRRAIGDAIATTPRERLAEVLAAVAPDLAQLDALAARLGALIPGGGASRLKERVVGPRVATLLAAIFERIDAAERTQIVGQVRLARNVLAGARIDRAVDPAQWVAWCAAALVRADTGGPPVPAGPPGVDRYRSLRRAEQRTPVCLVLRLVATEVVPTLAVAGDPAAADRAAIEALAGIPEGLRHDVVGADLARVERALGELETFWLAVVGGHDAPGDVPAARAREALATIAGSGILTLLRDEAALLRFDLEARLLAESFPAAAADVAKVRERIETLGRRVRTHVGEVGRLAGDQAWADALARPGA